MNCFTKTELNHDLGCYRLGSSNLVLRLVLGSTLGRNLLDYLLAGFVEDIHTPLSWEVESLMLLQSVQAIKRLLRKLLDLQVACDSGRCDTFGENDGVALDSPAGKQST